MNKIMTSMERWWMEKLAFTYQTWFTSPYPARKILAKFVRFQVPKLLRKDISQWRKGPTKNLLYSLECLLQKKKNGTVCKGLLTSKHLEISSSKKILTAVQWTPSWCMKRNESEIVKALTTFPFCSFVCCLIWPPGASSPCLHLQASWNFVIKKEYHCSTMDYILHLLSSFIRIRIPFFRRVEFWRFRQVWRPKLLKKI